MSGKNYVPDLSQTPQFQPKRAAFFVCNDEGVTFQVAIPTEDETEVMGLLLEVIQNKYGRIGAIYQPGLKLIEDDKPSAIAKPDAALIDHVERMKKAG